MLSIKSGKLAPTLAFALTSVVAAALSMSACATSQKAFIGDEGGLPDDDGGPLGEGGPNVEGGGEGGGDGGLGGPRIPCGPTFCRSDAKCVSNACTYDCTGTKVPGDYATITSAVTALAATAADVTICLGAIQAGESVSISDVGAHNKKLTIIATAPLQTTLGSVSVSSGFSDVTLIGFGTSSTLNVTGAAKVTLRALKLSSVSGAALQIRGSSATTPSTITVDACDIGSSSTSGYGVYVDSSLTSPLDVAVTNSYIHGGSYGVYQYGTSTSLALKITNNTIDKAQYGLNLGGSGTSAISYVNNIISNSTMVGVTVGTGLTAVTHSNNALFGNMTNYAGSAVEGTGYVKSDCQLDMSTGVPQTKAGSPCRGVGKADGAPGTDFWNASRGSKIDLGAVQGP
ncbi:hypothetical protein BH11MYX4_BH11MYX4_13000 [soil metagenome]